MELDLQFVRKQFPAFSAPATKDWAFFENAGGSYVPATVSDRLHRFLLSIRCSRIAFQHCLVKQVRKWMNPMRRSLH